MIAHILPLSFRERLLEWFLHEARGSLWFQGNGVSNYWR